MESDGDGFIGLLHGGSDQSGKDADVFLGVCYLKEIVLQIDAGSLRKGDSLIDEPIPQRFGSGFHDGFKEPCWDLEGDAGQALGRLG